LNEQYHTEELLEKNDFLKNEYKIKADYVSAMVKNNVFGMQDCMRQIELSLDPVAFKEAEKDYVSCLYLTTSFCNHSCLCNCQFYFIGNFIFVLATHDIPAGEEVLVSYYT